MRKCLSCGQCSEPKFFSDDYNFHIVIECECGRQSEWDAHTTAPKGHGVEDAFAALDREWPKVGDLKSVEDTNV